MSDVYMKGRLRKLVQCQSPPVLDPFGSSLLSLSYLHLSGIPLSWNTVCFHQDYFYIADGGLTRWKPHDSRGRGLIANCVHGITISPQGQIYLVDKYNGELRVYDPNTPELAPPRFVARIDDGFWVSILWFHMISYRRCRRYDVQRLNDPKRLGLFDAEPLYATVRYWFVPLLLLSQRCSLHIGNHWPRNRSGEALGGIQSGASFCGSSIWFRSSLHFCRPWRSSLHRWHGRLPWCLWTLGLPAAGSRAERASGTGPDGDGGCVRIATSLQLDQDWTRTGPGL